MEIKVLQDTLRLPKCSAKLSLVTRKFWHGRGRPGNEKGKSTCGCYAKYRIGKKNFCRKHAGLHLLDKMVEEQGDIKF